MNASIAGFAESLAGWLADFYLLATLLLGLNFVAFRWVRQPVHRLTAAWIVMIELAVLAVVCACRAGRGSRWSPERPARPQRRRASRLIFPSNRSCSRKFRWMTNP